MGDPELQPWIGAGYRHIRAGEGQDILDFRFAGLGANNRWNEEGSSALYLAGDPGIVAAEWGGRLGLNLAPGLSPSTQRAVFRLKIRLVSSIYMRLQRTVEPFGISWTPTWFLDSVVTRDLAKHIRRNTPAQAIKRDGIWSFSSKRSRGIRATGS